MVVLRPWDGAQNGGGTLGVKSKLTLRGSPLNKWVLRAEWMNRGHFLDPWWDWGCAHSLPADSFTGSSSDSLWKSPLTTVACAVRGMFSISSSEIPKVPTVGNWQREGEREKRGSKKRGRKGRRRRRRGTKERECGVRKTERLWMKRMESLESEGLYLILVSRQLMSNRGERDGGQERDHYGWQSHVRTGWRRAPSPSIQVGISSPIHVKQSKGGWGILHKTSSDGNKPNKTFLTVTSVDAHRPASMMLTGAFRYPN